MGRNIIVMSMIVVICIAPMVHVCGISDNVDPPDATTRNKDRNMDPIAYSTYFGMGLEGLEESFSDIAIDEEGYAYVVGSTYSTDLPTTPGVYQPSSNGFQDAFVCKFDPTLSSLVWCTYLGGSDRDTGTGIRLDVDGDLYVAGYTRSSDFPIVPSSSGSTINGNLDAFVCRMSSEGTDLKLSTFFGGADFEYAIEMELDGIGQLYILGDTGSSDLNGTSEAVQPGYKDGGRDGFIAKFNTSDLSLDYSSYLGGSGSDHASDLAIDGSGSVYIAGRTNSTDLHTTDGALQGEFNGGYYDGFVCKLSADGSSFIYLTYLGGRYIDDIGGIAVDGDGSAYVTGDTNSSDFPQPHGIRFMENGYYPTDMDVFVCKLEPNGASVDFTTFVGGTDELDAGNSIAMDEDGYIYVCGVAWSSDFPTTTRSFQASPGETSGSVFDGFAFMLSPDGSTLEYATYIGGTDYDWSMAVTVDDGGNMYVVGMTRSTDLPTTEGAYQPAFGGGPADAYVCRLPTDFKPPLADAGQDVRFERTRTVYFNGTGSMDNRVLKSWTWSFYYDGELVELHGPSPDFYFEIPGVYQVNLSIADAAGNIAEDNMMVYYLASEPPVANAGLDTVIDQHGTAIFNGTGSRDNVGVVNWTWRFYYNGTWTELEGPITEHLFDVAGDYEVDLLVRDSLGNFAKDTMTVIVRDTTEPTANAGSDMVVGTGEPVILDGSGSMDNMRIIEWKWVFDYQGLDIELEGEMATYFFDLPGVYNITLNVRDDVGLQSTAIVIYTVIDITPPVADASRDFEVDQHSKVTFSGVASTDNVDIVGWFWSFEYGGERIHLESEVTSFTFDDAGVYHVTLTVEDKEGNSATDEVVITVLDITDPVAATYDEYIMDMRSTIVLDASNSSDNVAITSYDWSFESWGEPVRLRGAKPLYRFDLPGTYTISLIVHDAAGNSDSEMFVLTVVDTDPPVIILTGPRAIDQGEKLILDASGSWDNLAIVEYRWAVVIDGEEIVSHEDRFVRTFDEPGEYLVTLTVKDADGNIDTMEHKVDVMGNSSAYWILAIALILMFGVVLMVMWRRHVAHKDGT